MNALKDLGPSIIRTVVPWLVGLLVAFLLDRGLSIDEATATAIVTTVVSTLYYAAVRVLETRLSPLWGWLLGSPKTPTYEPTPAAPQGFLGGETPIPGTTLPGVPPEAAAVTLHVRCPVCGKEVESVLSSDTWGESIPGDTGCGNVTLNDMAMSNHVSAEHTGAEIIRSLAKHYEAMVDHYPKALAVLRENHAEVLSS